MSEPAMTETPEESLVRIMAEKKMTIATAESCTGGLIAKRITDLPGASQVFLGGITAYTNAVKLDLLGISPAILELHGAVSKPVVKLMADNIRRFTGSDLAIAVTGVAGPDKDDRGNAVGTVYLALGTKDTIATLQLDLGTGRDRIRTMAAHHAFDLLRRYLTGLPLEGEYDG